jgi:hypothetical protein
MVTISGTVTDTILETGNGKEPLLKVVPIEACSISISAGCTETVLDKYFVKTDKAGYYSLTVNLPDVCVYKLYLFRFNGKTSTQTTVSSAFGIPADSITPVLKKDLNIPHQIPGDSLKTTQYAHYFGFRANNIIHGGDTVIVSHRIYGLSDNPDTLHFKKCTHRILLLTSSKDTVYKADFNCKDSASWVNLKKGWYTDFTFNVPVPKDLQKTNASFAMDRKLSLELKLNDHDITYTTPAFVVIDTDINVDNVTTAHSPKQIIVCSPKGVLAVKANQLYLHVSQSGIYSIALFSLDGRSEGYIVKGQYFSAGEHAFTMKKDVKSSSKLQVITLKGNGISANTLINNF